jgi:hypothetical protein
MFRKGIDCPFLHEKSEAVDSSGEQQVTKTATEQVIDGELDDSISGKFGPGVAIIDLQ